MISDPKIAFITFFLNLGAFCLMWYGAWWTIKDAVKTAIRESKLLVEEEQS